VALDELLVADVLDHRQPCFFTKAAASRGVQPVT
jgi:hypothetical protein